MTEFIFSYGTLQEPQVQEAIFGTTISGKTDAVTGFRLTQVEISDDEVVRVSGQTHHPMLVSSDNHTDAIPGMIYPLSAEQLARADEYEGAHYKRIEVNLVSGRKAWMYVAADF